MYLDLLLIDSNLTGPNFDMEAVWFGQLWIETRGYETAVGTYTIAILSH